MSEIIQKISSYNLFNYLLPGVVFCVMLEHITNFTITQSDLLINAFLFYFAGLCISRVGSIIVEPLLKEIGFVKFSDYGDFAKVAKANPKLEILSEANNTYRTLLATFVSLGIAKIYEKIAIYFEFSSDISLMLLVSALFILFLYSYKKQTLYVSKYIESHKESENGLRD